MRRIPIPKVVLWTAVSLSVLPGASQESASYRMTEHAFNAGGHPAEGTTPASASYRMSLEALGDPATAIESTAPSYRMDAGFTSAYPPPGEVWGLRFTDRDTLRWDPERSIGRYNLYRDLLSNLLGGSYGNCEQQDLTDETAIDAAVPPLFEGYFYLVTAQNRLDEEGALGEDGGGAERPNMTPCP